MTIKTQAGQLPHIEWIDLKQNGVMAECAILKRDHEGNITYFEVGPLDGIDKQRLIRILRSRNANNFELWDLMSQVTLNNGVNALDYFHQLAKIISQDGVIYNPKSGRIGTGTIDTNDQAEVATAKSPPVSKAKAAAKAKRRTID